MKIFWKKNGEAWQLCVEPSAKLLTLVNEGVWKVTCLGLEHIIPMILTDKGPAIRTPREAKEYSVELLKGYLTKDVLTGLNNVSC